MVLSHGTLVGKGGEMGNDAIRFQATTAKFTTLVDGTRRVYIDLLADTPYRVDANLIETQQPGIILEVAIVPVIIDKQQDNNAIQKGTERKSNWTPAET